VGLLYLYHLCLVPDMLVFLLDDLFKKNAQFALQT
jgi:hypothetical protein